MTSFSDMKKDTSTVEDGTKKLFESKIKLDPTWTGRRRVVGISLIATISLTGYAIFAGNDTAITPLVTLWGWIVTNYLGWPTVERINGIPSLNRERHRNRYNENFRDFD